MPLPGIEDLVMDLSTPDVHGVLNVKAKTDFLNLAIVAKAAGPIISSENASPLQTILLPSTSKEMPFSARHVTTTFSRLSLKYENNDPKWRFKYTWNYQDKKDFDYGRITIKEPYFMASSALFFDFEFNMFEGLTLAQARFVQKLDTHIGIEIDGNYHGFWEKPLANVDVVTWRIFILGIPISIKLNLKMGAFAIVDSDTLFTASYLLATPNAEVKAGWNNYNGLFNHYTFGDLVSNFQRDFDGTLTVIFGLNATLSVTISEAVTFYGTISPFIQGTVSNQICIDQLHLLVFFGLDMAIGMSDIHLNLLVKTFDIHSARRYDFELVRFNIMDGCSDSVPLESVTNALPDLAPRSYIGQMQIEGAGELEKFYLYYRKTSTETCSSISYRKCVIDDYLFLPHKQQVTIELWKHHRFWFDSKYHTFYIKADSEGQIVRYNDDHSRKYTFFVTETKEVSPNVYVRSTVTGPSHIFYEITATPDDQTWTSKKFLSSGSNVPVMRTFTAASPGASTSQTMFSESRGKNLSVPYSRMRTISWDCSRRYKYMKLSIDGVHHDMESYTGTVRTFISWPSSSVHIKIFEDGWIHDTTVVHMYVNEYHNGKISRTDSTSDSRCTLTVTVDYPPVFIELYNPKRQGTYTTTFVLSDDLYDFGCGSVVEKGFYHFRDFKENVFFHVTGHWYSVIDEDKVSKTAVIVTKPSVIVSIEEQDVCVTKVAVVVTIPRLATTNIPSISGMEAAVTRLHGDLWYSDMLFSTEFSFIDLVIENPTSNNFQVLIVYECTAKSCQEPVPSPTHEVLLRSGHPYIVDSIYMTDYTTNGTCSRCFVEYQLHDSNSITVRHSNNEFTFKGSSGSFYADECMFQTMHNSGTTFKSTCMFSFIEEPTVSAMGKSLVSTEDIDLLLNDDTSPVTNGYITLETPCEYCNIETSLYTGVYSVVYVEEHDRQVLSLTSHGPEYSSKLKFTPFNETSIKCKATKDTKALCTIPTLNVFDPQLEDPEFWKGI
ncbi:hypothetical protein GEMRC1_002222 [Eukaryota sp. GEM-RC1]